MEKVEFLALQTAKVELLKTWLESLGSEINPKLLYPFETNGLYGTITKDILSAEESLVLIKSQAILSTVLLIDSDLQRIFLCYPEFFGVENPEGLDNQYLALVIYEKSKKKQSFWKYYFDILPGQIENLCDWSNEELKELQDNDLLIDTEIRKVKNLSSYTTLQKILNSFPHFFPEPVKIEEIEWCWKVIWTRCFMRSTEHSALVPFADLFNHGESSTSFYFADQTEGFVDLYDDYDEIQAYDCIEELTCRDLYEINFASYDRYSSELADTEYMIKIEAFNFQKNLDESKKKTPKQEKITNSDFIVSVGKKQCFKAGDQVFLEYGNYSNTSLLIHYGFSVLNNKHEFFRLKVRLEGLLGADQLSYLPVRFNKNSCYLFNLNTKELNRDLLRYIRAIEWRPFHKSNSFFSQSDIDLEIKVIKKYLDLVNLEISGFSTSISDDRCSRTSSSRQRFAIIYRIEKKRVLHEHVGLLNYALETLQKIQMCQSFPVELEIPSELSSYFNCINFYLSKEFSEGHVSFIQK